jgi:hypothetical protein
MQKQGVILGNIEVPNTTAGDIDVWDS